MNTHNVANVSPAPPTDLVLAVTELLAKHNHPHPLVWTQGLHPDAFNQPDVTVQRFLINRRWRMILGLVTQENTMDIRYCLVDSGEISDWLRLFETKVLPCAIKYSLPL